MTLTSLCDPEVTERGLSCSDFSISSRKLMMLCSFASERRAPPSGSAGWRLICPWRSRLSVVKELESPSLVGRIQVHKNSEKVMFFFFTAVTQILTSSIQAYFSFCWIMGWHSCCGSCSSSLSVSINSLKMVLEEVPDLWSSTLTDLCRGSCTTEIKRWRPWTETGECLPSLMMDNCR